MRHYAPAALQAEKTDFDENLRYILNIVKHIQDYYAPILGEFEQVVLLTLLRLGNGAWGAAIRRDIRERTGRELPVSVVYVTLQRLEKKGMVRSYIGEPDGGARRPPPPALPDRHAGRTGARPFVPRLPDDCQRGLEQQLGNRL